MMVPFSPAQGLKSVNALPSKTALFPGDIQQIRGILYLYAHSSSAVLEITDKWLIKLIELSASPRKP